MSNERSYGIYGFLAGAAVGAALGILFAPRSGKETRDRIARRAQDAKVDLDEMLEHARAEWSKTKGKVGDAATMTKDEVNDFIHFLLAEGRDLKDRLSKNAEEAEGNVARAKRSAENAAHSSN